MAEQSVDNMPLNLKAVREAAEIAAIKRALYYSDYNISETSRLLGIARPTLYSLLEKHDLQDLVRHQLDQA
jgi:Transcriptional activator of acetoin/glycerol metabolism